MIDDPAFGEVLTTFWEAVSRDLSLTLTMTVRMRNRLRWAAMHPAPPRQLRKVTLRRRIARRQASLARYRPR